MQQKKRKKTEESEPLSPFFIFKNKETGNEIAKIISQFEGVHLEEVNEHLRKAYGRKQANVLLYMKSIIKLIREHNPHLSLSEIKWAMAIAFYDTLMQNYDKSKEMVDILTK